jgi:hypothetical protein
MWVRLVLVVSMSSTSTAGQREREMGFVSARQTSKYTLGRADAPVDAVRADGSVDAGRADGSVDAGRADGSVDAGRADASADAGSRDVPPNDQVCPMMGAANGVMGELLFPVGLDDT